MPVEEGILTSPRAALGHRALPTATPVVETVTLVASAALTAYLVTIEGIGPAVSWLLAGGLLAVAASALRRALPQAGIDLSTGVLAYVLISSVGLILIAIYRSLYAMDFGPWSDDSYYFTQMLDMSRGRSVEVFTLYEWVGAGWGLMIHWLCGGVSLLTILPLNWSLGAFSVLLAGALAREVASRPCPRWLLLAALLGNYVYTDAVVHLYRDALMIPLLLGALLLAVRKHWLLAIASAVLCGLVRGANGVMALGGVALLAIGNAPGAERRPGPVLLLCVLGLALGVLLDEFVHYGQYMRSIGEPSEVSDETLLDLSIQRSRRILGGEQKLFSEVATGGDDSVRALYAMGPAAAVLRPPVTVFAPFKIPPMHGEIRVRILQRPVFFVQGLLPYSWLQTLTALLWVAVGPLLLLGLVRAARAGLQTKVFVLLWSLAVLGVAFISFQHRHRCAFVVLAPIFLALAQRPWSFREKQAWGVLSVLFLLGLIIRNMGILI